MNLSTRNFSTRLVREVTADDTTIPSSLALGSGTPHLNLGDEVNGGQGTQTYANEIEVICSADPTDANNGTFTMYIYGQRDSGPQELVGSIAYTLTTASAATETGDYKWVDSASATNTHLSVNGIVVANSGNDDIVKIGFDAIGYRYLYFYIGSLTNIDTLRVYASYL